jgi:hypothetical protein
VVSRSLRLRLRLLLALRLSALSALRQQSAQRLRLLRLLLRLQLRLQLRLLQSNLIAEIESGEFDNFSTLFIFRLITIISTI